jgi:hypothetical protein
MPTRRRDYSWTIVLEGAVPERGGGSAEKSCQSSTISLPSVKGALNNCKNEARSIPRDIGNGRCRALRGSQMRRR